MKTIQLTDEQYNALMQGESVTIEPPKPKVEKWQPKAGKYYVDHSGCVVPSNHPNNFLVDFGLYYPTKESAEKARDAMKTHNRLLAWLAENDDGWVADWNDSHQSKYYIYYSKPDLKYVFIADWSAQNLTEVYMSEENAEKLCKLLNAGVVEL